MGLATVRILAFEDKGALWDVPYEEVGKYQFKKTSARASAVALEGIQQAITRFDRLLEISGEAGKKEQTVRAIADEREHAKMWLLQHSRFFQSGAAIPDGVAEGPCLLIADTQTYMAERQVLSMETFFTRQYVSYCYNESVKAHRIAIAELGLAPYKGKIPRNPFQLTGALSLEHRKDHVILHGICASDFRAVG